MRADIQIIISEIDKSLSLLRQRLDWDNVRKKREEFDALTEDPDLWNEPDKAQKLMRERQNFIDQVDAHDAMSTELKENIELIELAEVEADEEILQEVVTALQRLKNRASAKELEALLNGEADGNDTFLEIHAGAGGTESCDWAGMISRMYVRWAERSGYKVELQSETAGDEAGLKSVSYKISGQNAYGWLKTESGVHRLVRISPFDSAAKAMSDTSPILPAGICNLIASCCFSFNFSVIAVFTKPGAMQFTVMPREATSLAKDFDIPTNAALEAA